ncbi:MAG: hypothetical protein IKS90_06705 [Clostridia bacterium]|nr:hypothetical protein [Clostridia bacterium]
MLMTRQEIITKLKDILCSADPTILSRGIEPTEDTRLAQDLGLSSIGMLYIAIAIEETFSIRFDNVGVSDFVTVRDIVDYIAERIK